MSSSPASVLIVALELEGVNRPACGCNPNLSSTVHLTGDCRTTSVRSLPPHPPIVPFKALLLGHQDHGPSTNDTLRASPPWCVGVWGVRDPTYPRQLGSIEHAPS